jgi:hypothetical protein
MEITMNSYTKIPLILLLSSLTTLIHPTEKPAKEMAKHHEESATTQGGWAQAAFTSLLTTSSFEMLYRDLDKGGVRLPGSWPLWRRFNKPMLAVTAIAFVGTSGSYLYNACLAEHYKEESKKWFWQR